jgi:methylase of polypeptide subunit release factors
MARGGFDVIVGNPPYVTLGLGKKQESINENTINFYKNTYSNSIEYK